MNNTISARIEKLSTACEQINILDSSPDNTNRAINLLEQALAVVETCSSQEDFGRTQAHLRDNDPGLDIQAIRQLFKETSGILEKEQNGIDRKRVLETLVKRIDALSKRLDSAGKVYAQLQEIATADFEKSIMATGIQAGLISPTGDTLEESTDEVRKKTTELIAPAETALQGLHTVSRVMRATLLILSTAVLPMKMKAESALERLSGHSSTPSHLGL